jgi:hypothetical protein
MTDGKGSLTDREERAEVGVCGDDDAVIASGAVEDLLV